MKSSGAELALVIPTHNPEERILKRALWAIESFDRDGLIEVECVIVDNNSLRAVHELDCVAMFLEKCKWARVVSESNAGLVYARLAGIAATTAPVIIVFDDDNEPARDYLQVVNKYLEECPWVGVLGAGNISVEFLDSVPEHFPRQFGPIFNERHLPYAAYGCVPATWESYYPIGMGQVFRRPVANEYVAGVKNGRLRATGRMRSSMASGEDIQLVWEAVKMGFAAGVHPELKINHMIPGRRCTATYARKVAFGCAASYAPALVECFPSERNNISAGILPNRKIVMKLVRIVARCLRRGRLRWMPIEIAEFLGSVIGSLRATQNQTRQWTFGLARLLGME